MKITKEHLKAEINYIQDQDIEILYRILQAFIQVPHVQSVNHDPIVRSIEPVTLSLDDTFASVEPLAQPLDYQTMRRIALDERATKTIREMCE